jgi:hypothetical protein
VQPNLPIQILPLEPQILLFDKVRFTHFFVSIPPHLIPRLPHRFSISFGQLLRQSIQVVVLVAHALMLTRAVHSSQRYIAVFFIDIEAGLAMPMLLQQAAPGSCVGWPLGQRIRERSRPLP